MTLHDLTQFAAERGWVVRAHGDGHCDYWRMVGEKVGGHCWPYDHAALLIEVSSSEQIDCITHAAGAAALKCAACCTSALQHLVQWCNRCKLQFCTSAPQNLQIGQ